jgi:nucleotide-binding universal stress UspA family protein
MSDGEPSYDEILVPTSGEQRIETVVEHTKTVANEDDATAHVLYVVDNQSFLTLDEDIKSEVVEEMRQEGKAAVQKTSQLLEKAGIAVETAITQGKPADEILAYVADEQIDIVTMGTRGDDYTDNMLGSTAQSVVSESPVPVLTVNHSAIEGPSKAQD